MIARRHPGSASGHVLLASGVSSEACMRVRRVARLFPHRHGAARHRRLCQIPQWAAVVGVPLLAAMRVRAHAPNYNWRCLTSILSILI